MTYQDSEVHAGFVCKACRELVAKQAAEIERLQDAKRRALAIADERGKENDRLRADLAKIRTALYRYYEGGIGVKGMCEDIGTVLDNQLIGTEQLAGDQK